MGELTVEVGVFAVQHAVGVGGQVHPHGLVSFDRRGDLGGLGHPLRQPQERSFYGHGIEVVAPRADELAFAGLGHREPVAVQLDLGFGHVPERVPARRVFDDRVVADRLAAVAVEARLVDEVVGEAVVDVERVVLVDGAADEGVDESGAVGEFAVALVADDQLGAVAAGETDIASPAVFVIGEVVRLRERLTASARSQQRPEFAGQAQSGD